VVVSLARHRSSLAIGNIVGSTISNILGAFSLGLLFHNKDVPVVFDRSSKLYSLLLLVITSLTAGLLGFARNIMWRVLGSVIIGVFTVYIFSISWAIRNGFVAVPELSDSDDSDDSDSDVNERHEVSVSRRRSSTRRQRVTDIPEETSFEQEIELPDRTQHNQDESTSPDVAAANSASSLASSTTKRTLTYHLALLIAGFLAILLSAFVLSQAASNIVSQSGISDVAFGVVILSIATTIPEKFIAVVSGTRGHMGIIVANTVGSNIFLLTLCMGILWTSTDGDLDQGSVNPAEIGVMLGSTVLMTITIWLGSKWVRYVGAAMLAAYIAFIVLEFTIIRPV
jgi:Ca2+/Na+ antiporter